MAEFELIERIRRRVPAASGVVVGIGDDAAVLAPTPGHELVATTDSLVLDRHFTAAWHPADVGYLAVQANLSDLAAMGATPRWALLALTLPEADADWLDGLLDGFLEAAAETGLALVGGNLARGPLNIGVQLLGEVPAGRAVTRRGAQAGDRLVVTGTLGDAAAALELGGHAPTALQERLHRPTARVHAGTVLAGAARAMIDLSDGLLADLGHLLGQGQGADLDLDALPVSNALLDAVDAQADRWRLQTGGGSDYELLAVLPEAKIANLPQLAAQAGVALSDIGRVTDGGQVRCLDGQGRPVELNTPGWDHFHGP
jgi:thiamine-monophosphate kinase